MSYALSSRIQKAAEILSTTEKTIEEKLKEAGVDNDINGLQLLEAATTELPFIEYEILKGIQAPVLKKKAAASILKGNNPFKMEDTSNKHIVKSDSVEESNATRALSSMRPLDQWGDKELLETFNEDRDSRYEDELNKRAKGQRFIILKNDSVNNTEEKSIDIEVSLQLLKKSRKHKIPTFMPSSDDTFVPVYRITDINTQDRVIEMCPFCGEFLFKGYCEKCTTHFVDVDDECLTFMKIVVDEGYTSKTEFSERRALLAAASKGLAELRKIYHKADYKYRELRLSNNLPKLRRVRGIPTEIVDPFCISRKRRF